MKVILSLKVNPLLFGKVRECRKSETLSNASLDGVETAYPIVNVSPAPVESGLDSDPPPFSIPVSKVKIVT